MHAVWGKKITAGPRRLSYEIWYDPAVSPCVTASNHTRVQGEGGVNLSSSRPTTRMVENLPEGPKATSLYRGLGNLHIIFLCKQLMCRLVREYYKNIKAAIRQRHTSIIHPERRVSNSPLRHLLLRPMSHAKMSSRIALCCNGLHILCKMRQGALQESHEFAESAISAGG
jgi:hypothetical protein